MIISNPYLPNVVFEAIPIKNLVNDQDYQRTLSEKQITRAANDFDLHQLNPVKVSRRNGINYVVNGQHTMEIVAKVSGSRETPVWCMVYDDLEYQREADIFANQQKYVKPLTNYEIFMANVEAGNDKQLLLKSLVESYELQIACVNKPGCIVAVGGLEYIYDRYGYDVLSRTLRLLLATWEGTENSFNASLMKGTAKVLYCYDTEIKDEVFVKKLGEISLRELIRTARARRGGPMGFAEAIVVIYNKKQRFGLQLEKLYSHKSNPLKTQSKLDDGNSIALAQEGEINVGSINYTELFS